VPISVAKEYAMSNWNIKPKRSNKKRAKKIKSALSEREKIRKKIHCNNETAKKKTEFDSEQDRKLMAQMFFK
jgi:hypothetical protein